MMEVKENSSGKVPGNSCETQQNVTVNKCGDKNKIENFQEYFDAYEHLEESRSEIESGPIEMKVYQQTNKGKQYLKEIASRYKTSEKEKETPKQKVCYQIKESGEKNIKDKEFEIKSKQWQAYIQTDCKCFEATVARFVHKLWSYVVVGVSMLMQTVTISPSMQAMQVLKTVNNVKSTASITLSKIKMNHDKIRSAATKIVQRMCTTVKKYNCHKKEKKYRQVDKRNKYSTKAIAIMVSVIILPCMISQSPQFNLKEYESDVNESNVSEVRGYNKEASTDEDSQKSHHHGSKQLIDLTNLENIQLLAFESEEEAADNKFLIKQVVLDEKLAQFLEVYEKLQKDTQFGDEYILQNLKLTTKNVQDYNNIQEINHQLDKASDDFEVLIDIVEEADLDDAYWD